MSWDTLSWTPASASNPDGASAIAELVPMFQSALEEAVSALLMGSVTIAAADVATTSAADLPAGFAAVSTFELHGTARREAWAAGAPDAAIQSLRDAAAGGRPNTGAAT